MWNNKNFFILIIVTFLTIFNLFFWSNYTYDNINFLNKTPLNTTHRFITCTFEHFSGFGNQLFRIASLYGMGQALDRQVYFNGELPSIIEAFSKYSFYLPNVVDYVKIINSSLLNETRANFSNNERLYENPLVLSEISSKYLKISGNYLQSVKYFDNYEADIKHFFKCHLGVVSETNRKAFVQWGNNWNTNKHNLCVHTRRGDFVGTVIHHPSSAEFTSSAYPLVLDHLLLSQEKNVNVIFFGDDSTFIKSLNKTEKADVQLYYGTDLGFDNIEDFCFATNNCDSFLLTATGSTYGWWMAYLKSKHGDVYYEDKINESNVTEWVLDDYVPPRWKKVCNESGTLQLSVNSKCGLGQIE